MKREERRQEAELMALVHGELDGDEAVECGSRDLAWREEYAELLRLDEALQRSLVEGEGEPQWRLDGRRRQAIRQAARAAEVEAEREGQTIFFPTHREGGSRAGWWVAGGAVAAGLVALLTVDGGSSGGMRVGANGVAGLEEVVESGHFSLGRWEQCVVGEGRLPGREEFALGDLVGEREWGTEETLFEAKVGGVSLRSVMWLCGVRPGVVLSVLEVENASSELAWEVEVRFHAEAVRGCQVVGGEGVELGAVEGKKLVLKGAGKGAQRVFLWLQTTSGGGLDRLASVELVTTVPESARGRQQIYDGLGVGALGTTPSAEEEWVGLLVAYGRLLPEGGELAVEEARMGELRVLADAARELLPKMTSSEERQALELIMLSAGLQGAQ